MLINLNRQGDVNDISPKNREWNFSDAQLLPKLLLFSFGAITKQAAYSRPG
jgi:hypothetical protein